MQLIMLACRNNLLTTESRPPLILLSPVIASFLYL